MNIADIIYQQLGGGRFIAMTGCNSFIWDDRNNSLQMCIPRNSSKANRLTITYKPDDTYNMRFWRYTSCRWSSKYAKMYPEKYTDIKVFDGVYCDQLQELFTEVTGMYTRL